MDARSGVVSQDSLVHVLRGTVRGLAAYLAKDDPGALRAYLEQKREWAQRFPEHHTAYAEAIALLEEAIRENIDPEG